MRFAYADPPYLGMGKFYKELHPEAMTWDDPETHRKLVGRLVEEFPDGWAMSLTSTTLRTILPMCPEKARVGAWTKPFCSFKKNVNPAYAWEPVIFMGGRKFGNTIDTVRDWCAVSIALKKGLVGAKPEGFCYWIFSLLGARGGDELVDLFPGSGAVSDAWTKWTNQLRLA